MRNIKEFYIQGIPIDTPLGEAHFIKVKDYPNLYEYLNIISLSREQIINIYKDSNVTGKNIDEYRLVDLILLDKSTISMYLYVFHKVFGEVVETEDGYKEILKNFDYYRKLILDMNCLKEEKINPNPEIQKWIEKSKKLKQFENGDQLSFADILSCVSLEKHLSYEEINEMTLYQLYFDFQRIAISKNYNTSTLFATVSTEKVDIESWCKHIDLFADEKIGIGKEEFNKTIGNILGG